MGDSGASDGERGFLEAGSVNFGFDFGVNLA